MTEQERQLKKTQLYQDIDLLDRDFAQQYSLHPISGRPLNIIAPPATVTLSLLILGFMIFVIICFIITPKSEYFPPVLMFAILLFIILMTGIIADANHKPKYNKYLADKKAYEKKRAELRRQYDAL